MKIGTNDISKLYLGSAEIEKIYLGTSEVYEGEEPNPYASKHLTFVAEADNCTIQAVDAHSNVFQYSVDSGTTWYNLANNESTSSVNSGETILFKATGLTVNSGDGIGTLKPSVSASVQGNIMSLVYGDDFSGQMTITNANQFLGLFYRCSYITSAEHLILPATTLTDQCYRALFSGCENLTTTPELPATTLAYGCYYYMFRDCYNLTTAPVLPATTLADSCYYSMFYNCASLTTAPALPATTLASECYYSMFYNCASLTTAPALPATTLASQCYYSMFYNCRSLTTAPELPATTLSNSCYVNMFYGCSSLTVAPELPATTLTSSCYNSMFKGCTSLTTAPELSATTLVSGCYNGMFSGCTSLSAVTCLAENPNGSTGSTSSSAYTVNWLKSVASSGTFVKAASMSSWTTGVDGIPQGWTVQNDDGSLYIDGGGLGGDDAD